MSCRGDVFEPANPKACTVQAIATVTAPAVSMLSPAFLLFGLAPGSCVASRNSCQAAGPDTACIATGQRTCRWAAAGLTTCQLWRLTDCDYVPAKGAGRRRRVVQSAPVWLSAPPIACGPCAQVGPGINIVQLALHFSMCHVQKRVKPGTGPRRAPLQLGGIHALRLALRQPPSVVHGGCPSTCQDTVCSDGNTPGWTVLPTAGATGANRPIAAAASGVPHLSCQHASAVRSALLSGQPCAPASLRSMCTSLPFGAKRYVAQACSMQHVDFWPTLLC